MSYSSLCKLDGQALVGQSEEVKKSQASMAQWNHDVEQAERNQQQAITQSISDLLPEGILRDSLPPETQKLLDRYAVADSLALLLQSKLTGYSTIVLLLASTGLICFELTHFFNHFAGDYTKWLVPLLMSAFIILWIAAIYFNRKAHHEHIQERYQDYRVLAEGLRVQFYWHWAGVNEKAGDAYPKRQREHLHWMRFALDQWQPRPDEKHHDPKTVLAAWINDQLEFFAGSSGSPGEVDNNRRLNMQCLQMGRQLLLLGLILGAMSAAVLWSGTSWLSHETYHTLVTVLPMLAGLGIVGAGICYAWRERFAYAEHVNNYEAMVKIYQEAQQRMKDSTTIPEAVLVDLGREALAESTDWLMLHRERHPTDPVQAV